MPTFSLIACNPYGAWVEEDSSGNRRVASLQGWVEEKLLPPHCACRIKSSQDIFLAAQAMALPVISKSFQHRIAAAYQVWTQSVGIHTPKSEKTLIALERSADPRWLFFEREVKKARGDRSLRAWAENSGWIPGLARWEVLGESPNATIGSRGVQIGLARQLAIRHQKDPDERWVELGVLESPDAATWKLPECSRVIYGARENTHPSSPPMKSVPRLPHPPQQKASTVRGGFRPEGMVAPSFLNVELDDLSDDRASRLVWCTTATVAYWGDQVWKDWWFWFARGGIGIVVFDALSSEEQKQLLAILQDHKRSAQRWVIKGPNQDHRASCWIFSEMKDKWSSSDWEWGRWLGPPPPMREVCPELEEDNQGRVAYRLGSGEASNAFAPRRLENAMHHALTHTGISMEQFQVQVWDWIFSKEDRIESATQWKSCLTGEQWDAVLLGFQALSRKQGMILADETGFGKGRILALLTFIGLALGKTVIFITENAQLFSDFYRDLLAVCPDRVEKLNPLILHQDAVIQSPSGNLWARSLSGEAFVSLLKSKPQLDTPSLIFTTYAQLNRSGKDHPKLDWLTRHSLGAWILLDEAHNAAGDSNVSTNLQKPFRQSEGVIFSSATFAKHEENLDLYRRVFPVSDWAFKVIKRALMHDHSEGIREALTTALASDGQLVRREHPPIDPPTPIWISSPDHHEVLQHFSQMWQKIFEASELWEVSQGGRSTIAWLKLGSALSRSIREFSMYLKSDFLVNWIAEQIKNQEKVVVVMESTLEAALKEALGETEALSEGSDEELEGDVESPKKRRKRGGLLADLDVPLQWRYRWLAVLQKIAPLEVLDGDLREEAVLARGAIEEAMLAIDRLPAWDLSPIDAVRRALSARGISSEELSGRKTEVRLEKTRWQVASRSPLSRMEIVRRFNSGQSDVLFLTRAGCAGISIHAGIQFKDQRRRNLVEWGVAANPSSRVQFWGRVRRRDQVCEPRFWGLALDTLFDRRMVENENRKRKRLSAHGGSVQTIPELDWFSREGEEILSEWAMDYPRQARRLGLLYPIPNEPTGRIERALLRAIVLPEEDQERLLNRLSRGILLASPVSFQERSDPWKVPSRAVRRAWWFGHPKAHHAQGEMGMARLDVVERSWDSTQHDSSAAIQHELGAILPDSKLFGMDALQQWKNQWTMETRRGIPVTETRQQEWKWLSSILPNCCRGYVIRVARPSSGEAVWGVILEVDTPSKDQDWALSQAALKVWLLGEASPIVISLRRCRMDPWFQILPQEVSIEKFQVPMAPKIGITLEGNPILAAHWGGRWGVGQPKLIQDEERGLQWVWAFPHSWTFKDVLSLPRDLVGVEHALECWNTFPGQVLHATLPTGEELEGSLGGGYLILSFSPSAHKKALESWLNFKWNRALSTPRWVDGKWIRQIAWSQVRPFLYSMEAGGIGWRVSLTAGQEVWYQKSSQNQMEYLQ